MIKVEFFTLPLFFSFSFILLLSILSMRFFFQTRKYSYLSLSIAFLISSVLASTPLFSSKLYYFDSMQMMALTGMSGSLLAIFYTQAPANKKIWLPIGILTAISGLTIFLPFPVNCLILSISMISYGIYSLMKGEWTGNVSLYTFHSVLFIIMGGLSAIGIFYRYSPLYLLISLFSLIQVLLVFLFFFDRVVLMMRVASYNSVTDPLTGIYNKRFMLNKVKQLAAAQEISIIFADIDNFKKLNDTKGHDEGDRVLKEVANCLKNVINRQGYPCRFGGEEVVGIVTSGNALEMAEKFRMKVEKEIGVTVSVGVSSGKGEGDKLIKDADLFMYQAKNGGKNKVVSSGDLTG